MDLLTELVFVLTQYQISIPEGILPRNSKLKRLYLAISSNKVRTDNEAASLIYDSNAKDKRYLMLKRNLVTRLADLVLEAEPNEVYKDNYSYIQFLCEQKLAVTEKLLQQNVYHNAEKIIQKVQLKADKYHLISVQFRCAQQLRTIYALKGFPNETEMYDSAVGILAKHSVYESKAQGFSQIVQSKVKFFISYNPQLVAQAKSFASQIAEWLKEFPSPFLQLYYHRVQIAWQHQEFEMDLWQNSLLEFQELPKHYTFLRSVNLDLEIHLEWVKYYRAKNDLPQMNTSLQECLKISDYQAFNKFEVMSYYFDWAMRRLDWEKATEIISEVYQAVQFESLDSIDRAIWGVKELYLHFILYSHLGEVTAIQKLKLSDKKLAFEFLSQKQPISRDKKGYNLHLVILRLLFQLLYGQVTSNEGNKMLVYFQRHLKSLEDKRTGIFFKSLAKIASSEFDIGHISRREEKFRDRLESATPSYDDCEIIPYEYLWESVKGLNKIRL